MNYSKAPFCDTQTPDTLSHLPEMQARLLANRGIVTREDADIFLNPDYTKLYDPYLMHDMEKAVVRIYEVMVANEKIVIYSDYDCDGIPGGTILHDLFKKIGYVNFENYIPHRHDEGYGLNREAVDEFIANGVKLIITVDLGTSDIDDIAQAQANGVDVVVTDHHEPPPALPKAFAIVNPKLGDYPDPMLCGAGVAFKLTQAFIQKYGELYSIPEGWEKWLLDMAGLGTLADMVPLTNENRIIAHYGLKVLRKTRRPGLRELLHMMKINLLYMTEDDIGFMIAPRINAASRMDIPYRAFELLSTTDLHQAKLHAEHLCRLNDDRKSQVATIMREINKLMKEREDAPVIVIGNPTWSAGVLGLVASKVMEAHGKSVFVWGGENGNGIKGSCRGNGVFSVVELMRSAPEGTFAHFGGHEHAGGFSLSVEQVVVLEQKLIETFATIVQKEVKDGGLPLIDAVVPIEQIHRSLAKEIEVLAPFGVGNPKPLFLVPNVSVKSAKHFGKEKNHFEVVIEGEHGKQIKAIKFFAGKESFAVPVEEGSTVSLLGYVEESHFGGKNEIRMRIEEII